MKINHKLNSTFLSKNTKETPNFMITNKVGGYCLLGENSNSRYQGVFLMHNSNMYKVIENIELKNAGPIKEIINKFSSIKRKKGSYTEEFFMPYGYDTLVYELDKEGEIELTLDIRESYGNPEFGRNYKIKKSKSSAIVTYKVEYTNMYLVIKNDNGTIEAIKECIKRDYAFDKKRNRSHDEKYVYT